MTGILDWFAGGSRPYMTLYHCMAHDKLWVAITVGLDLTVAAGYVLIARHWGLNQKALPDSPAKAALGRMKNIFILCGLCGYLFIPIKMVWPAWRLYDIFLVFLAISTWRYAWGARQLRVIYSHLRHSERLAKDLEASRAESRRKTDVFNAVGHDLRTPLNGIVLQAELADMILADPAAGDDGRPALREALGAIRANADAAAELLGRLLEFGRLQRGDEPRRAPERVDLAAMLDRLAARFRPEAERKGLALRTGGPPGLSARLDRLALERALSNLIDNALKFTATGAIEVAAERAASDIRIHVIDSGPGIDPEHLDQLFDEFYQVHNHERDRTKGFGLGLAIARRLAEDLGGGIGVESRLGRGSRFTLRIPEAQAEPDADADADADRDRPRLAAAALDR